MTLKAFKFQSKTKFLFGVDSIRMLGPEVRSLGIQKVFIATDPGIVKAGLVEPVATSLEGAEVKCVVYEGIEPNPTDLTLLQGGDAMRRSGADAIVGLGGGSPMDASKGIAVMAANHGEVLDYCQGTDPWPVPPKPIIAVPTTAGTGSEVSAAAMVNVTSHKMKMAFFGPSILPDLAIADPALTLGLPPRLTALTGIDALCHAMEAYVCARANPISDAIAERSIEMIAGNLRQAFANGGNTEARGAMLLASAMAIMAASNAGGLGIIHSLAQTLGGYYDLPHGLTIAVCFTAGLSYNVISMPEKHARMAQLLGVRTDSLAPREAGQAVVSAVEQLLHDLDITDDLSSLGVDPVDLPRLSQICMLDGSTPVNPRTIDEKGFETLYANMLNGN